MRAIVFDGQSVRVDRDRPAPTPAGDEVVVRPTLAGICSTDLELARGYMGYEGVLGHEFVGVVDGVADDASPEAMGLLGQRVVGAINAACGRCDLCGRGLPTHCRNRTVLGIVGRDGCFAERFTLPASNLLAVPDDLPDERAVFTEPVAAACNAQHFVDPSCRSATVLGDGRLGLLVAQVLASAGVPVRVVGKHPEKLALAERWGLRAERTDQVRPQADEDVVVDCTGAAAGLSMAIALVRPRGRLVLKTTVAGQSGVDLAPVVINEIDVVGSRCGRMDEGLALLEEDAVDVRSLISRRMSLGEGVEAFQVASQPGVVKVLLDPTRDGPA